jgi:hypothetical protein
VLGNCQVLATWLGKLQVQWDTSSWSDSSSSSSEVEEEQGP